jgi:transglutaminase superfamily protein
LNAKDLYAGYEARKVLLSDDGAKLGLDPRVFKHGRERKGVVTTDPIDLGQRIGIVGTYAHVTGVEVEVKAEVPEGASVLTETRTGANALDTSGWSDWTTLRGGKGALDKLAGRRYIQVRMTLKAPNATTLPALTGLTLKPKIVIAKRAAWSPVRVVKSDVQKIVRSAVVFNYERPDQKDIVKFRKDNKLDEVVKGAKDDFEKLVRLMDWVGSCKNDRSKKPHYYNRRYTWDINRVFKIVGGKPTIYGHCMSYAEVMCYAAVSMGYVSARHSSVGGFRQATHEVCDIWVPSMGKWVYFDPSLTSYYRDKRTNEPLSILGTHKVIIDNFIPEGKDMRWFHQRRSSETYAMMRKVGGKKPITCRLGPWRYGAPMPRNYNWGWSHSYLANGFVNMTPRNDFQSHPEKMPRRFGNMVVSSAYPSWVDHKTPILRGAANWFTRERDFYWTLDQASFNLVRVGSKTITVELGQTMPFFKRYKLTVNGKETTTAKSAYRWRLQPGENTLVAAPVDEFGKVGLSSSVTLKLAQ